MKQYTMAAKKSLDLGDGMKDQSEHTSLSHTGRIAGTSTTTHDQRGHFALDVAGIMLVDQCGVLSNGCTMKDERGAHVYQILKRVRKYGGDGLRGG
jgi:hypothetical protein